MATLEELRPRDRLLVMDLVAEAGQDVSDWSNYAGKHPAANPRYCYEWVFTQEGAASVACLWFDNIEVAPDGSVLQRLNLWDIAKKHESLPGRSAVAKRARAMDIALQSSFRTRSQIRVVFVDGEQADLVAQNAQSSKVERRRLDPAPWTVDEYDWTTGACLLVRGEQVNPDTRGIDGVKRSPENPDVASSPSVTTYAARLAYNSAGWRRPTSAREVQEAGDTYRNENGFGHEDWLFRDEWQLDGWRYGFVQGVNSSRTKLLRDAMPFNLRLFTMPAPADRRAVAEIRDVECLNDETAAAAVADYERMGWLNIMRAEVAAAGGRPAALDETGYAPHVLNLRYRPKRLNMLDAGTSVPVDDAVHRLKRYGLYATPGAMDTAKDLTGKPIGTAPVSAAPLTMEDYRQSLVHVEIAENQRRWLIAHYYSPDATVSMPQLALALGYADHSAADSAYGALARKVADALPSTTYDLGGENDGNWHLALATLVERDDLEERQWRLRDEVAQAMQELGWVEARDTGTSDAIDLPTEDDRRVARDYGLDDTQIRQMMLSRRGQGRFRSETLRFWGGRCAVSGLSESCFLVASHIKPWKAANPNERLDGFNGLALTPNLDRAFDRGYISFADDGSMLISPAMSSESMHALGIRPNMALLMRDARTCVYLAYHRDRIFLGATYAST
jgi:hypothetical protein